MHDAPPHFKCSVCGHIYDTLQGLRIHIAHMHKSQQEELLMELSNGN